MIKWAQNRRRRPGGEDIQGLLLDRTVLAKQGKKV
jgi:hypothetical protein